MDLKKGDKILCRRTYINFIPNKNENYIVWKFGKRYKVKEVVNYLTRSGGTGYRMETENVKYPLLDIFTYTNLKEYFLIEEKRIRRFKLNKLKNKSGDK